MSAFKELLTQVRTLPQQIRTPEYRQYLMSTHFWGPVANWGIVLAGFVDMWKPPDMISAPMTSALCVYSLLFMRFAWMVKPRNMLLFSCHFSNECVQLYQLSRKAKYELLDKKEAEAAN
ncbi:pyruvate transporter mpc1 [Balamuthia mandrillaris]